MKGECVRSDRKRWLMSLAVSCGKETPWNAEVTPVILPVLGGGGCWLDLSDLVISRGSV